VTVRKLSVHLMSTSARIGIKNEINMKKIIAILIICLISTAGVKKTHAKEDNPIKTTTPSKKKDKSDNNPLKITVEIIKKTESPYHFKMSILNQTDSVYGLWLMTCSTEDNIRSNTSSIQLYGHGCDSNYPELIELKPGKVHIIEGKFSVSLTAIKKEKNIRFGLILIAKEDYNYSTGGATFEKRNQTKGIIWSQPIKYNW